MVCPLTLSAATPVGASTTTFLPSDDAAVRMKSIKVDLPVPAPPVTKIRGIPFRIAVIAVLNSSVISMGSFSTFMVAASRSAFICLLWQPDGDVFWRVESIAAAKLHTIW